MPRSRMVYRARARRALGQLDAASGDARRAQQLLTGLMQTGDHAEPTAIALAFAYLVESQILDNRNDPQGRVASQKAAQLLRPLAENAQAVGRRTPRVRRGPLAHWLRADARAAARGGGGHRT